MQLLHHNEIETKIKKKKLGYISINYSYHEEKLESCVKFSVCSYVYMHVDLFCSAV